MILTFLEHNPTLAAWLIGGLIAIVGSLIAAVWALLNHRLNKLEEAQEKVQDDMATMQTTAGITAEALSEVKKAVDGVRDRLEDLFTDNLAAHAGLGERITKVEARMPNGELTEALKILRRLDPGKPPSL